MNSGALHIEQLGCLDYSSTWEAMRNYAQHRTDADPDRIWLLEHPPVFTLGQAGRDEHVLNPGDIPLVRSDRGGQVTYHGPGQIVAYLLIDLRRRNLHVRQLVDLIELSLIDTLGDFGMTAERKPDAPGVYVGGRKIASLGLRIRKGCSYHGLALNVDMDLSPFERINPCGFSGLQMTDMRRELPEGTNPHRQQIETALARNLSLHLGDETAFEHIRASSLPRTGVFDHD